MKNLTLGFSLLTIALFQSCSGGGGSAPHVDACVSNCGPVYVDKVDKFVDLLNDKYSYDSYFYVVKRPEQTLSEDFVVVYSNDSGYVAYDIKDYRVGDSWYDYSMHADYQEVYIDRVETDWHSGEKFYYGDAYNNDFFGSYAGEFVFEEADEKIKDLAKVVAVKEAFTLSKQSEAIAAEFGLSEEKATKVAKLASNWKKLSKDRSMTSKDADLFTKELLGVDVKTVETAYASMAEGDSSKMKSVLGQAAKKMESTPEHMKEIMDLMLNGENN